MTNYIKKFDLSGRKAFVMGGGGLLGSEIAIALCQAGAHSIVMDVAGSRAREHVEQWKAEGLACTFVELDITELETVEDRLSELWGLHGPANILVNAAYPRTEDWGRESVGITVDSLRKNVDMQLNSTYISSRAIAELMKKDGVKGSVILIGSIYGVVGNDMTIYENTPLRSVGAYSLIKGGITNMTRYMASYYGRSGVRFNIICPGGIFDHQDETFVMQYSNRTPLARMGYADEVASSALFLASDAASYITGACLMVDGGWTAI